MILEKSIGEHCQVNTNNEGDSFVGVKANTDDVVIHFPIGYQLPANDDDLRTDIHNLFMVLETFMKEERVLEVSKLSEKETVGFPMHAYLKIIRAFLRTGKYYIETDPRYRTDSKGTVSWPRTVKKQRALMQKNGSLIFTNFTVRSTNPNAAKKITQIHRYCVFEAFEKMGWLYVPYMPEAPGPHPDNKEAIYILTQKLTSTNNDYEQELFSAMRDMLMYEDEKNESKQFFFGTDYFERVWEKMIDKAFGVDNKEDYFPRTRWILDHGKDKIKAPLQPDSIMIYGDNTYVLDSKLYRYGLTENPEHLPNGSDISKQITYGEYVEMSKGISSDNLYNAFIMPFNKAENIFKGIGEIGNIGEAVGEWKPNIKKYERVQGIVIDTRFLMYNYKCMPLQKKKELAETIQKVDTRDPVPPPRS